ncbi:MAG: DUF5131 family protein, partial [Dehalococcoidia bacterium]
QCGVQRVPFFFKQWGAFDETGRRVGKKGSGRRLGNRTWDGFPGQPNRITVPAG